MGRKLAIAFEEERKFIRTAKFQDFFDAILKKCDDLNATEPASSSGKYHPICDLGEGGLVRHSKIVAYLTDVMLSTMPKYDDNTNHDIVFVAALLHDMCKYDKNVDDGAHSNFDHPVKMAELIRTAYPEDEDFERVAKIVETHMSRWNGIYDYSSGKKVQIGEMPTPETLEQYIVVFADIISSRKELPGILEDYEKEAINKIVGRT